MLLMKITSQSQNVFLLFVPVWFIVGSAGAFFFILIQLVLLVDFAHSWNESWVEKMETGNARLWYIGERLKLGKCVCVIVLTLINVAFSSNLCVSIAQYNSLQLHPVIYGHRALLLLLR